MDSTCITLPQHGIIVSTAITAGGSQPQHAEGIIVSTAVAAGGNVNQHAEASSS